MKRATKRRKIREDKIEKREERLAILLPNQIKEAITVNVILAHSDKLLQISDQVEVLWLALALRVNKTQLMKKRMALGSLVYKGS